MRFAGAVKSWTNFEIWPLEITIYLRIYYILIFIFCVLLKISVGNGIAAWGWRGAAGYGEAGVQHCFSSGCLLAVPQLANVCTPSNQCLKASQYKAAVEQQECKSLTLFNLITYLLFIRQHSMYGPWKGPPSLVSLGSGIYLFKKFYVNIWPNKKIIKVIYFLYYKGLVLGYQSQ